MNIRCKCLLLLAGGFLLVYTRAAWAQRESATAPVARRAREVEIVSFTTSNDRSPVDVMLTVRNNTSQPLPVQVSIGVRGSAKLSSGGSKAGTIAGGSTQTFTFTIEAVGNGGGYVITPKAVPQVQVNWSRDVPKEVRDAMEEVMYDPNIPYDLTLMLAKPPRGIAAVQFVWQENASGVSNSVWFLRENKLAVGPKFKDLESEARKQMLILELGKLILHRAEDNQYDLAKQFRSKFAGRPGIPRLSALRELGVTDSDGYTEFGCAYYYYLFDKASLRNSGLADLVTEWDKRPPHSILNSR
jgi:hypothetical protein